MNVGLIAFSGLRVKNAELAELGLTLPGFIERRKVIASLPSLGLLTLAALTPESIDVEYIEIQDVQNYESLLNRFDLVAISSFTAQIYEAYKLARLLKDSNTCVVMGGLHVTALPEEAGQYADAVVVGEAEGCWPELLEDFRHGRLKSVYNGFEFPVDLSMLPVPRYDLLDIDSYNRLTVQTQRGCPFRCEFCASSIRLSPRYKLKSVDQVVNEINAVKRLWLNPFIELADDNTFVNKRYSKELVESIGRLDIKWFTETDVSVAEDSELLDLLAQSGCRQLLIGFESPVKRGLNQLELNANWKSRQHDIYMTAIDKIQSKGISVNGCFVLGLDGTDESSFEQVYQFVKSSGLSEVQITIQTPFPGTELYSRLKGAGRLLRDEFWDQCTLFDVTYIPELMTVKALEDGFRDLMCKLYSDEEASSRKRKFLSAARRARA